ncbi:DUF2946 family protein [Caenispirillum salinarum]|uniref:DUF2946 family protein n=1 Tax=Caenispirillum salinarum TaxID=859058 RepID=UPI00384D9D94
MQHRSYTARRGRERSGPGGFAVWLASVALLLQIVVPLGQAVPLPVGADGFPRSLVVCTAYGPRAMTPDQQDARGRAASPSGASHSCPVCTALGFCGLDAPVAAAPLPAALPLQVSAESPSSPHADRRPWSRLARGPPAA